MSIYDFAYDKRISVALMKQANGMIYLSYIVKVFLKCVFNSTNRVATIIEVPAGDIAIFYVTIPGDDIGRVLKILNINGVGTDFGAISVSTVDCMLPSFSTIKSARLKRLSDAQRQSMVETNTNHTLGFAQFQTARLTTEEIYNKIVGMAKMVRYLLVLTID